MKSEGYWKRFYGTIGRLSRERIQKNVYSLLEERKLLKDILEHLPFGVALLDERKNLVYSNPFLRKLDWEEFREILQEKGIFEKNNWAGEVAKDGTSPRYFWIEKKNLPPYQIIGIFELTHLRKEEQEKTLREKFSSFKYLSAGIAHEIGNPLNAIKIHAELLDKSLKSENLKKSEEHLEVIKEELERLDRIIKDFLNALRPVTLHREEERIENILISLKDLLLPSFQKKKVELIMNLSPTTPPLLIDRERMKQVFLNLLNNALQATSPGKRVFVSTGEERGMVYVIIRDEGEGIEEHNLSRIFEPFYTTRKEGTGLGLVITHKIIKAHGGEIKVRSSPGKGSTFIVYIPIVRKEIPLPAIKK